jgi:hypothetical protein
MKIAFFVIFSITVLFVSCERKENKNISIQNDFNANTVETRNLEYDNTAETIEHKNDEPIYNIEILSLEKPIAIIENGEPRYLQFPNSKRINIRENHSRLYIQTIKVYDDVNKEANFTELKNKHVTLIRLPETEDWLYLIYSSDIHGFINVYDLSSNNSDENELLQRFPNARRYGPLLEIHYNNNVKKIWDYFGGEMGGRRYEVKNCYKEYDEILIVSYGYEHDVSYFIYNMRLDTTFDLADIPVYNSSRDTAFCALYDYLFNGGINIFIYRINNGIYEEIVNEILFKDNRNIQTSDSYWINNNEFKIELFDSENRNSTKNIIGRRNGSTFQLILNME